VGSLSTWKIVKSRGNTVAGAIKTDGTLWTWGSGNYGGTGQNNISNLSSPVQVGSLTTWQSLTAGANLIMAIKT
jgi:alpha-tubulin suppressor-like RCC1 family protein